MQKRAPALLDNLVQAFLMAPFFVLLEVNFCIAVVCWQHCCFAGWTTWPLMTILFVSDSSHIWRVRTVSWLPWQGEQVDWGSPEGMGGQEIKEVLMRYVWINGSELLRSACSRWTCWIGWICCKDGYWIPILFMLYKMMCTMLSAIFLYIILVINRGK